MCEKYTEREVSWVMSWNTVEIEIVDAEWLDRDVMTGFMWLIKFLGNKLLYGHVPDPFPQCRIGSGHTRLGGGREGRRKQVTYTHVLRGILSHVTFLTGIVLILQNTASHTPGSLQWSHWCYLSRRGEWGGRGWRGGKGGREEWEGGEGKEKELQLVLSWGSVLWQPTSICTCVLVPL